MIESALNLQFGTIREMLASAIRSTIPKKIHFKVMEFTEWDYFDTMKTNQVSISFNLTRLSATMENTQSYD